MRVPQEKSRMSLRLSGLRLFRHSGMRRRDKMAKLFCAEGAGPESISPGILWPDGFSDVQLYIKVRSLHSRPGMTVCVLQDHCEEQSDEAIQHVIAKSWIVSLHSQ